MRDMRSEFIKAIAEEQDLSAWLWVNRVHVNGYDLADVIELLVEAIDKDAPELWGYIVRDNAFPED